MKKRLAISISALVAGVALAAPAPALPTGPGVGDGKNISVFHNLDFVAAFGYDVGERLEVEVWRGGVPIGQAAGSAVAVDEGLPKAGALEVHHGPEGTPVEGDCWTGYTPDILPGDRIVVKSVGGTVTDEVLVDDIGISGPPVEDLSTPDTSDIIVEGRAAYADGTPIPVEALDCGELRLGSTTFRANPNAVERIGTDGWRATYRAPYAAFKGQGLSLSQQKQAILTGDHAMGYGHVAPLPKETQLVEGLGGGGPALGCESSPSAPNAVATFDDRFVNLTSGDLRVNGVAAAATESVSISVDDEDPATPAVTAAVAPEDLPAAGPGARPGR